MAKQSVKARNAKRVRCEFLKREKRAEYKAKFLDQELSLAERLTWHQKLQKLPRDSSSTRQVNRCRITGRGRGVSRKYGISRIKLREHAMKGHIPGLVMASW